MKRWPPACRSSPPGGRGGGIDRARGERLADRRALERGSDRRRASGVVRHPDLRSRIGTAARAAIEKHTWDRVAAQTMAVYHEVVAQADRGNPPEGGDDDHDRCEQSVSPS